MEEKYQKEIANLKIDTDIEGLSYKEKNILKSKIMSEITGAPIVSVFSIKDIMQSFVFRTSVSVVTAFVLILTPTVYASNSSLPGDKLYFFKTSVNEKMVGLITSSYNQSQYQISLIDKRVDELTTLAERKKLDTEKILILEEKIRGHSNSVLIKKDENKKDTAKDIEDKSDLLESLGTYRELVGIVGNPEFQEKASAMIDVTVDYMEESIELLEENYGTNEVNISLQNQISDISREVDDTLNDVNTVQDINSAEEVQKIIPRLNDAFSNSDDVGNQTGEQKEEMIKQLLGNKTKLGVIRKVNVLRTRLENAEKLNQSIKEDGGDIKHIDTIDYL